MEETILFGSKRNFGIEVGFTKTKKKYKLRFWLKNNSLGAFTKSGELKESIREYNKFVNNKEDYYLPIFDAFSSTEIMYYLVDFFLTDDRDKVGEDEIDKRMEFYLFFGDQFSTQTGGFLLLYKYPNVIFIIKRPMDGPVDRYDIDFFTFCKVFDEYINYVTLNNLI
jgi:hypothetical protein